jgi:hypothetical protein
MISMQGGSKQTDVQGQIEHFVAVNMQLTVILENIVLHSDAVRVQIDVDQVDAVVTQIVNCLKRLKSTWWKEGLVKLAKDPKRKLCSTGNRQRLLASPTNLARQIIMSCSMLVHGMECFMEMISTRLSRSIAFSIQKRLVPYWASKIPHLVPSVPQIGIALMSSIRHLCHVLISYQKIALKTRTCLL